MISDYCMGYTPVYDLISLCVYVAHATVTRIRTSFCPISYALTAASHTSRDTYAFADEREPLYSTFCAVFGIATHFCMNQHWGSKYLNLSHLGAHLCEPRSKDGASTFPEAGQCSGRRIDPHFHSTGMTTPLGQVF